MGKCLPSAETPAPLGTQRGPWSPEGSGHGSFSLGSEAGVLATSLDEASVSELCSQLFSTHS